MPWKILKVQYALNPKQLAQISIRRPVIFFSPSGKPLNQRLLQQWQGLHGFILICGRYQGVDQRFIDAYVDECLSLGDYVLSGGELAAMCFIDALVRQLPQVLGNQDSHQSDSFANVECQRLSSPDYTRPDVVEDGLGRTYEVPKMLTSGNHRQIHHWREWQSLEKTDFYRPELLSSNDIRQLQQYRRVFNTPHENSVRE